MMYNILLFLSIVFNVIAQMTLKYGARNHEIIQTNASLFEKITTIITPFFIVAAFFYGMSLLAYSIVLSKMEISKAYPISVISAVVLILLISTIFYRKTLVFLE